MNVLVVDDNAVNLKLARLLLTSEGFTVRTATDAREATAALESFTPAVILMDVQLPDIDGLELTRRLKSDPRWSEVPVVALTAYAMKSDEERAMAAGCDLFLTKPVAPDVLLAAITRLVGAPEG